ncbi:tRNA glutamyl-Q(34) synthetase GluQRS [Skermania piniformis]|uniref:Glutamyl-Q tRNA(Asp) synthetase n=1 Tax=Skermania pinensis TaxID=39122 RepID=A0ABX8S8H9_9ACTN|nr:tRNA glutamyl-Q(34) synthetase GluQRS [Skermania piniformis]QXQ14129.1 tRNA glutamyl-Q(34) synthetase GluQRS [Skermania piniformis]
MADGRFAPSPSGDLHLGNLRTALLAWLFARSTGSRFRLRFDDLDRVRPGAAQRQRDDLAALGIDWDPPVWRQSERASAYADAITDLADRGATYECYCTRREIQQAPSAPHAPPGAYPGTCRNLSAGRRAELQADGRRPALRLRATVDEFTVIDDLRGRYTGSVDDLVLRRGDGVVAYNLAVVVDDAAQRIEQVVRGGDLLASTPRQAYLASVLGLPPLRYAHVPLVLNADGRRLAKRDGAVTLADRRARGQSPAEVRRALSHSLDLPATDTIEQLLTAFDPDKLPRSPWRYTDARTTLTPRLT